MIGKASKVGGVVTGVFGWLVMLFGLSVALALGVILYALWKPLIAIAVALTVVTLGVGVPLVMGGKALRRLAADTEREMRERTLFSMLSERGRVSAAQAAGMLGTGVGEADAQLTALAKGQPDRVAVDVDEEGTVWYRAAAMPLPQGAWAAPARVRVDERSGAHEEAEAAEDASTGRAGGKTAS